MIWGTIEDFQQPAFYEAFRDYVLTQKDYE